MGIGFTLETLKALNSFDINCFVLKVSQHWVSVLSYNYVWPRGPALFATLGVPNAAGFPENLQARFEPCLLLYCNAYLFCGGFVAF